MGERKVQAKYYPPDFDPSLVPRAKKKRPNEDAVRFMLPMSVRCESCGEFMGTGLKFNARKSFTGDNYLGIRIFRFKMRCKGCPASFSIRTDPKNSDYDCELGVRRNFEPWREAEELQQKADEERAGKNKNAIEVLESKTQDAKQEMEELDALDHIKSLNAKRAKVNVDDVLASYKQDDDGLSAADERKIQLQAQATLSERAKAVMNPDRPESSISEKAPRKQPQQNAIQKSILFHQSGVRVKVKKKSLPQSIEVIDGGGEQTASSPAKTTAELAVSYYDSSSSSDSSSDEAHDGRS